MVEKTKPNGALSSADSAAIQHMLNILQKTVRPGRKIEAEICGVVLRAENTEEPK